MTTTVEGASSTRPFDPDYSRARDALISAALAVLTLDHDVNAGKDGGYWTLVDQADDALADAALALVAAVDALPEQEQPAGWRDPAPGPQIVAREAVQP